MVMVLVIWIVLVLTVIAYSLAYEMRISIKMTGQGQKRLKAQGLARAGLARAVMDLRNDRLLALADNSNNNDTLGDVWAKPEGKTDVPYGGGFYNVLIVDEERKLNVNALMPNSAVVLQYLLEEVGGMKKEVAEVAANAIIDYKDPDSIPIGGKGANEIEYYTDWAQKIMRRNIERNWVFRPKNDMLLTLSEMLDIPGITPEILYGNPEGMPEDPFEKTLLKKRTESKALIDYLTANSAGQLNLNTCPVKLLEAVLYGATKDKTAVKWADKIDKARQDFFRKKSTDGGVGLNGMQALIQEGIPAEIVGAMEKAIPIGFNSTFFTITSRGRIRRRARYDPGPCGGQDRSALQHGRVGQARA